MNIRRAFTPVNTLLVVLLIGLPGAAQSQEQRLVGKMADESRLQVDLVLDSARADGLPTEPLVDRALEGAAKGASGDLIVRAVRRLRDELQTASDAFGATAVPAEVVAGASALRAGATHDDLVRLRDAREVGRMTVPAAVLADLVAAGVPSDTAIAAVMALAGDLADAQYLAFRRNVEQDIALGASPSAALGVRLGGFGDALEVASPNSLGSNDGPPQKRNRSAPARLTLRQVGAAACLFTAFFLIGPPTAAQTVGTLDLGGTVVEYDGFLLSGAAFASPSIHFDTDRSSAGAQASWVVFESGNQILQFSAAGAWLTRPSGPWRAEFSGSFGAGEVRRKRWFRSSVSANSGASCERPFRDLGWFGYRPIIW